jgi:hypothetical protein
MIVPNANGDQKIDRKVICICLSYDSIFIRGVVRGMIDNFHTQIIDLQVILVVSADVFTFEAYMRRAFTERPDIDFIVALDRTATPIARQVAREFDRRDMPIVAVDFASDFVSMSVEYPYGQVQGELYKRVVPFSEEGLQMLSERS